MFLFFFFFLGVVFSFVLTGLTPGTESVNCFFIIVGILLILRIYHQYSRVLGCVCLASIDPTYHQRDCGVVGAKYTGFCSINYGQGKWAGEMMGPDKNGQDKNGGRRSLDVNIMDNGLGC